MNILFQAFKKAGKAEKEVSDGSLRHDISTEMGVDRLLIDVGVTAAKYKRDPLVPSDQEVQAAIQAHKSQSLNEETLCENESDEDPTFEVLQLRTFRRLVVEEAVSPALNDMLQRKINRFTNNYHPASAVYPGKFRTFLMTAGGANGQDADKLMKNLVKELDNCVSFSNKKS